MIVRSIAWSAGHPRLVLAAACLTAAAGFLAQRSLPRDVIPDLSDPQVGLVADWMGHPAHEVATSITSRLTAALDGVPGAVAVRGSSMAGMAYVDVVFASPALLAAGRDVIAARVEAVRPRLPADVRLTVGPEASSTGWVLQYALVAPPADPSETLLALRSFQDDVLRPALAAIPGVAEVATLGGQVEEVRVEVAPERLRDAGVALSDIVWTLHGVLSDPGRATLAAIETARLAVPGQDPITHGQPPLLRDVVHVQVVTAMAGGIADLDGRWPAVGGIVVARPDADLTTLAARVRDALDREAGRVPAGGKLVVVYDRSELVGRVERTLVRALGEEAAVVVAVVLVFLLHGRSALVPMLTLPLVVSMTFAAMWALGLPATVMSLGGIGIALGMAVDADLVALEACHRRLESNGEGAGGGSRRARLVEAAGSFAPAILTSLLIAALTFVPVFAFTGESGRLLRPLALTKTVVVLAAAIVTLTAAPALRDRLLGGRVVPEMANPLTRHLVRAYRPFVHFALARPVFTLATASLAAVSCLPIVARLGAEFLPRLDEGDLLFMPTTLPGVPAHEAAMQLRRQDGAIRRQPEVRAVLGKVGRADTATDPAPFSMAETIVALRPRAQWPKHHRPRWYSSWAPTPLKPVLGLAWPEEAPATTIELIERLDGAARLPGWTSAWTAPIRARMDMMSTGVRTPVGIRIVASDPARLDRLGDTVRSAALAVPGAKSAVYESLGGETRLTFAPDAGAVDALRVDPALVRSIGALLTTGGQVGEILHRGRPLRVRVALAGTRPAEVPEKLLREATVRSSRPGGPPVPLGLLGRVVFTTVPSMVRVERGEPVAYVYVDLHDGADVLGYVDRARREIGQSSRGESGWLGSGERIEWTGQYALMAAGQRRLKAIAPVVLASMVALLFMQFRSVTEALIVLVSVPFALVGSFWTLYVLEYRLSAPVWVGLLSVVGLAMQTGVVMVVYIDAAFHRRLRAARIGSRDDIVAAHTEGTVRRLRPKVMTIATMAAGLMPFLWAEGAGSEIMRRVAAPMVGGLVTSAFLTLEVIPVLYTIWRSHQLRQAQRRGVPLETIVGTAPGWAREPSGPRATPGEDLAQARDGQGDMASNFGQDFVA